MKWHIGCSGYHYREWKNLFYPEGLPQRKWFEFYNRHFDTIELNNTFYKFPQAKNLQNWYSLSNPDFHFSVKAPGLITHYKQFNDCNGLLDDFYGAVQEGLKEKLGALLFQMPPKLNYTPVRLEMILKSLKPGFTNVVEFRHLSWWNEEIFKILGDSNIIFCGISHPTLPDTTVINHRIAYYRFHGVPDLYYSNYELEMLYRVADQFSTSSILQQVYIYYNNTATLNAINNARSIKEYLGFINSKLTEPGQHKLPF